MTVHLTDLDAIISLDLQFRSLKTEGKGKCKINPMVLALETPDSIFCDKAKVEIIPDDNVVNIEFTAKAELGTIGVTMSLETLEKIIAGLKEKEA